MTRATLLAWLAAGTWALAGAAAAQDKSPKAVYEGTCSACHASGVLDAPKFGNAAQWAPRLKVGMEALLKSAIAGTAKGMPPKGGRADLSDAQFRAVVEYLVAGGAPGAAVAKAPALAPPAKPAAAATAPPPAPQATAPAVTPPAPAATAATAQPPLQALATRAAPTPAPGPEVNAFNRLLKPLGRINRPAVESGIHDPGNDMTLQLQPPAVAFEGLPRSMAGNHIDWVKSLDSKAITPRWDRLDPAAAAIVMDLNIVREVKGSMPDVVYPHKQHTEWLDCSNCHPAIFLPQKGANQISMAAILLGQKCGVCHGKVAFPVSECRLCHSRKKTAATVAGDAKP
jgi:c(7)-type cytochrome triheme protein